MAFSGIAFLGWAPSTVTHASLAVSPTAALTVGKEIFVSCVSDNLTTTEGPTTYHLVTDSKGHTWTKVFEETDTDGAAADGSTTSLWTTKITTQIETTDSITNTYQGGSNDAGIIAIVEAVVGAGQTVAWETPGLTHSNSGTDIAASLTGLPSREYLFFGLHGAEGNDAAKTAIAGYTEQLDNRSGANSVTDVHIHIGTRILTGTEDTWHSTSTTFTNGIQSLTGFYEVAEVAAADNPYPYVGGGYYPTQG